MTTENQRLGFVFARELMIALGLLALVFISFGHQPVQAGGQVYVYADGSVPVYCGSGPQSDGLPTGAHCDACLLTQGVALPPTHQPEHFTYANVLHLAEISFREVVKVSSTHLPCGSRGPPIA